MAVQSVVLSGTSTPQVVAGSIDAGGPYHGYIRVSLKAVAGTAYLGSSDVTTAGYPLTTADSVLNTTLLTGETLYFATSSGASMTLAVLRTNETT